MSESVIPEETKAMTGLDTGPGEPLQIEKGAVRRFAEASMDASLLYRDETYARDAGYERIPAPPTFLLYNMRSGTERDFEIPLPLKRRMKGGDELEFLAPVLAGDTITANTKILDIYEKEGRTGKMVFVVSETTYRNQHDVVVMKSRATIVRR